MHAVLQPSAAHRWVECPGSVQAQQQYPNDDSDEAREGTATHWVGEQALRSYQSEEVKVAAQFLGEVAPNGVVITEEMVEGAELYVMDVLKVCQAGGYLRALQIEQPVTIERVHPLNWGTPDAMIWDAENGKLFIWDFKFGRVAVECCDNWQLIEYALGALEVNGIVDQLVTVEMRVVQPRSFHVEGSCRGWTLPAINLRGHANRLSQAAELSQQDEPPTKAGEWCRHCTASKDCMTLQRAGAEITDRVELLHLHNLSPENRAVELRYLRRASVLLKERLGALETEILEQHKAGNFTPGFAIGHGQPSIKWNKPIIEVFAMGDLMGIELRKKEAPITPTQAKKLNVDEAVINDYSQNHDGKMCLVTDDKTITSRIFARNN